MRREIALMVGGLVLAPVGLAHAQSTGMPAYNAPYRAFDRHEFGGTLAFLENDLTAVEGQYRFGYRNWDVGVRGGIIDTPVDTEVLLGTTGRVRAFTHTEQLPFDGAVVVGAGTQGFENFLVPVGVSLGRRIDVEDSPVSVVPYAQPTMFLRFDDIAFTDTIIFAFAAGVDVRLSRLFDLRVSGSLGDVEGIAISAVWVQ